MEAPREVIWIEAPSEAIWVEAPTENIWGRFQGLIEALPTAVFN